LGLFLLVSLIGLSAAVYRDNPYSPFDKEFYLTDEQVAFIRPGYNIDVTDYSIAADGTVSVVYTLTDNDGQPLDINGVYTPGACTVSFVIARIPADKSQYVAYATRTQTSPINGASAVQPTSDSGGKLEQIEIGTYRYTFKNKLPEGYDQSATHAIGYYGSRTLTEWDLGSPMDDGVVQFVPNGSPVEKVRDLANDAACAQCHDNLIAHGRRHSYQLCIMCHYDGVVDPDTGNSVDMAVMIHKIHRGAGLPSVQAGTPYQIIGHQQSVADFSTVGFPQDIRFCDTCHAPDASQAAQYYTNPTTPACTSCHDNVNVRTGLNHAGGPTKTDMYCKNCHFPQGELEFDSSVLGAHTVPTHSAQLPGVNVAILDVTNVAPGQSPTVVYRVTNDAGQVLDPKSLTSLSFLLAGPTTDYTTQVSESAAAASVPVGALSETGVAETGDYAYTFKAAIPADAEGTFAIGVEGRKDVTINPGLVNAQVVRDALENSVVYVAVTDEEPVMRRKIVDDAKCESCHRDLALHGFNRRNATDYCQLCHRPGADDSPYRPADKLPVRSIDFKFMIHRIHMGEEMSRDFTIIGYHGSVVNYNEVRYPSSRANCAKCHDGDTYNVPSPGVEPTVDENEFFSPIPPNSAACLGCHDTLDAAAHAYTNISPFGEGCGTCHGASRDFAVAKVHAQ